MVSMSGLRSFPLVLVAVLCLYPLIIELEWGDIPAALSFLQCNSAVLCLAFFVYL